jgi:hypothetical protein
MTHAGPLPLDGRVVWTAAGEGPVRHGVVFA